MTWIGESRCIRRRTGGVLMIERATKPGAPERSAQHVASDFCFGKRRTIAPHAQA
jgi:hypothetical protein